eukprot:1960342-Prymnesium_polylepis.1
MNKGIERLAKIHPHLSLRRSGPALRRVLAWYLVAQRRTHGISIRSDFGRLTQLLCPCHGS